MRNKILLSLLIVSVFVLGVLSVRAWDHYQITDRVKAEAVKIQEASRERQLEREVEALKAAEQERAAAEAAERKRLDEVCQSMEETYSKLTPFQKTITEEPNCRLEQVQ
jgi:biopolymer transport protein ExbB/TolQ